MTTSAGRLRYDTLRAERDQATRVPAATVNVGDRVIPDHGTIPVTITGPTLIDGLTHSRLQCKPGGQYMIRSDSMVLRLGGDQ